jgi:acyl carrier protein
LARLPVKTPGVDSDGLSCDNGAVPRHEKACATRKRHIRDTRECPFEEVIAADVTPLESEVAGLIVETLDLKIEPAHIEPEAPLFGAGLGLDSIDALELSLAISRAYGYRLRSDDPHITETFSSLRALCSAIARCRTK